VDLSYNVSAMVELRFLQKAEQFIPDTNTSCIGIDNITYFVVYVSIRSFNNIYTSWLLHFCWHKIVRLGGTCNTFCCLHENSSMKQYEAASFVMPAICHVEHNNTTDCSLTVPTPYCFSSQWRVDSGQRHNPHTNLYSEFD